MFTCRITSGLGPQIIITNSLIIPPPSSWGRLLYKLLSADDPYLLYTQHTLGRFMMANSSAKEGSATNEGIQQYYINKIEELQVRGVCNIVLWWALIILYTTPHCKPISHPPHTPPPPHTHPHISHLPHSTYHTHTPTHTSHTSPTTYPLSTQCLRSPRTCADLRLRGMNSTLRYGCWGRSYNYYKSRAHTWERLSRRWTRRKYWLRFVKWMIVFRSGYFHFSILNFNTAFFSKLGRYFCRLVTFRLLL